MSLLQKLTLQEWDAHYARLRQEGLREPAYGGPLSRHVLTEGDLRLKQLKFDASPAALRLWNFLLTENQRLRAAKARGEKLVGTMKDLGTIPVLAYALPGVRAFYPDGAWWTPCLMQHSDRLLDAAEKLGIGATFCPVRAMLPAFQSAEHFPIPDFLVCSTGAVCDDFSAIAQRLERLGFPISWWEMPRRRESEPAEPSYVLPGGALAPASQVRCVQLELERIGKLLGNLAGRPLDDALLAEGIRQANRVRSLLKQLRTLAYHSAVTPMPALEMLVVEMLAIHFCSDREETIQVLTGLLAEVQARVARSDSLLDEHAVRVFWVNPVADLRAMNLLEEWGGRICGTDYMFAHALDAIPENLPPWEALARTALADPMVGSTQERGKRLLGECQAAHAEAVVISRIPGASHCGREGAILRQMVSEKLGLPCVEIEIPPVCDSLIPTLGSRLQALVETARMRRR